MVPRFYLHLRYRDRFFRDDEGDALPDETAVRPHAIAAARDLIWNTRTTTVRNWFDCTFEVADQTGHTVLVMPFGEVIGDD